MPPQQAVQPLLVLKVVDMTRLDSSIVYNPNRGINEDRPWNEDYSIKDINTVLTRVKIVITMLDQILDADMFVFYFYYPRFSYTCWFFC